MRLAVLVTCFNRKEITVKNLTHLDNCLDAIHSLEHSMFIVDDGSTDGTGEALQTALPYASVVEGSGDLYWNGGMCKAYESARTQGSFDAYLMFNDDVFVLPDKLEILILEYFQINHQSTAILAAATESEIDHSITYSAKMMVNPNRPLSLASIQPNGSLQKCDTFNGNFVIVPGVFLESVGGNDPKYIHAYGDIDLGLVAKKRGVQTFLASTTIGYCEANSISQGKQEPGNPILARLNQVVFGSWGLVNDDIDQRLHYIFKHGRFPFTYALAAKSIIQYYLNKLRIKFSRKL